jgi:uncharacterized protein with beta-barrel porin domain
VTGGVGFQAGNNVTVTNSGTIAGTVSDAIFTHSILNLTNSGAISAVIVGIDTPNVNLTNLSTGTIGGAVDGMIVADILNISNAGAIRSGGGAAINSAGIATISSNTGTISGFTFGIETFDTSTITNNGGGVIEATGPNGVAIGSSDTTPINTVTLANAGTVQANGSGGIAVLGQTVNVSNTGTISADAVVIKTTGSATVNNAGSISAGVNGFGISGPIANVTNSGTISAGSNGRGISTGIANVTNFGIISGGEGIVAANANIANSGMISGKIAIQDNGPTTITNSGTIRSTDGATGTAIQLTSAADTLNIKNGSSIVGLIDMGHGADVINVDSTSPSVARGVSMLSRATSAVVDALKLQLRNFDGVINIIGGGGSGPVQPSVTANGTTASLDPTALAQQDRALMDFTGGMSSMVQGRLGGAATGSGPQAMSYAMEDARAEMFTKAPAASWSAPVNVWTSAFGATRSQNGTDTTLDSTSSVYGGVIGLDRRIRPDWLVGAFAGGGSGTLNVDLGSQKVRTDYFSGGAYSRFEWASQFFDMTLQAGGINNRSTRLVQNNIAGGQEYASASYNGWFVSPEVAYGYHIDLGNGTMVTPSARVRYVAGLFGGYTETGSAQTLSIGSRALQDFEERGEVEVSKTGLFGNAALKGSFHGGVIALQRVGDTNVNAVLIGQSLSFITPGKSSAVGVVGGAGLDYHVTPNVALFGAVEGMMMSDESRIASAKGGVRVAF